MQSKASLLSLSNVILSLVATFDTHLVAAVTGIQIAIAVLGGFRSVRLERYVGCLEASLEDTLKEAGVDNINVTSIDLPSNFTYPVRTSYHYQTA